ncbi:MAG: hypothetical protein Q9218_005100 [Villophora microphyllina]
MEDDPDDASETSERTVLSESEDEVPDHSPPVSALKDGAVDGVQTTTHLANIWQFLVSPAASELDRFHTYNFMPAETVTDIARGTSYLVTKSRLLIPGPHQVVAIKHVLPQQPNSHAGSSQYTQNTYETVLHELRILAHKPVRANVNVAQLFGYGAEGVGKHLTIYLVAAFAPGGILKDYLTEQPNGPVSILARAHFCYDISTGLAGLHACSIAQGDLKLANVLVFADKDGFVAKLCDFGCAIYGGSSIYSGTPIYNAPEIRRGRSTGIGSRVDFYASDIFSLGLVIWEILQRGKPFIDPALKESHLVWLNGLPKDELLLQALQTFETLPFEGTFPKRVIRDVLEGSLRDEPQQRIKSQAIVNIFRSDGTFSGSKSITNTSYIEPSEIPPLQEWSFARTDKLARTVPVALQTELYAQLKSDVDCTAKAVINHADFNLAICHLTGFGTRVSLDECVATLTKGALGGERYSSGMCLRMHSAAHVPMNATLPIDQPMIQVEYALQRVPDELYYSHRIREHERTLQQALLDMPFDLSSGAEMSKRAASFKDNDILDAIKTSLQHSFKDALPLLAVSEFLDHEGIHHFFHAAARLGLIDIVRVFLEAGVDVNSRDNSGATPLIAACRGGHAGIVRLLMDHGADSWNRQRNGISPFHWLIMFNDDEIPSVMKNLRKTHNTMVMDAVVFEPVEMLQHGLRLRWSPVHFAVAVRNITVTKALLAAGASTKGGSTTPLNIAVANHCPEMTGLLLSHGPPSWQLTPFLHIGEESTLKLMLLHGNQRRQNLDQTAQEVLKSAYGDINQKDPDGYTALAEAIMAMPCDVDLAVLECLLDHGARLDVEAHQFVYSLNSRGDGRAAAILDFLIGMNAVDITQQLLKEAIRVGDRAILESILATGIDVNASDKENLPALMCAVLFSKNSDAVQAIINHGADVNAQFQVGSETKSALEMCLALPEGDGQMLDALIKGGASLTTPDGSTILHQASHLPARVNGAHVLKHLLNDHPQLHAFINYVNRDHYTPIHVACFCGNLEAVSILLDNGADVDVTTNFNPIATTEYMAMNPDERSVPFERGGFKLELWKLTAEAVLMKLLDKCDPGHGQNSLHIATRICNYDRVVELVERGVQPWRGDSKNVTPIGLLPEEVFEHDEEQANAPPKDFIVQGLKIKKYLEHHMITRTSQVKSLDMIDDAPLPMAPEKDSPFQLEAYFKNMIDEAQTKFGEDHIKTLTAMSNLSETYMIQERWSEAEELQRLILRKIQSSGICEDPAHNEVRSSLVRTFIAINKLEEAESLASASLAEATSKAVKSSQPLEAPSLQTIKTVLKSPDPASMIDGAGTASSSPVAQPVSADTTALDSCLKIYCETKDSALALTLFDISLLIEARGRKLEAVRMKETIIEAMPTMSSCGKDHFHRMLGYLICNYCGLERWDDAEQQLQRCFGLLEFVAAEHFPRTRSNLLHVAGVFQTYGKWSQAEEIYQTLHQHTVRFRGRDSYYSINTLRLTVDLLTLQVKYKEAGAVQLQILDIYRRLYGPNSAETLCGVLELAQIYEKEDRLVECVILQRQALYAFQGLGDENHQNILEAKRLLCKTLTKQQSLDEAELLARENLAEFREVYGENANAAIGATSDLALVLNYQDRCEESIVLYKEVLEKREKANGEMHELVCIAMVDLLPVYIRANKLEEAELIGKRAVRVSETVYGSESIKAVTVLFYLSSVYEKAGQMEKSRDVRMQVLGLERKLLPSWDKDILYTMTELAYTHFALGEIDEAIDLQLQALTGYQQLEGDHAMKIIEAIFALACSYHDASRLQDARLRYEEAIAMSRSLLGDQDERTIAKLAPLMALYTETDEYDLAKALAYETLWFMEKTHGDDHSKTQEARRNVIIIMTSLDKWREAERQAKKLVTSLERTSGKTHADTIHALNRLANCLTEQDKHQQAEPLYDQVLQYHRTHLPPEDESTTKAMTSLVSTLRNLDKFSEAGILNQELLDVLSRTLGPDHDTTLYTASIKANILYSQERYPETATLELEIISARVSSLGLSDPKTLEAKENLSKTYLAQENFVKAAAYAEEVLEVREQSGVADTDEDMVSTVENLKEIYTAAQRWDDAERMAEREETAKKV